jgi:anti-anti-sigma regulatory factor
VLDIVKEQNGGILTVRMTGSIEESVDFDKLIGSPPAELVVSTKGVNRINSVGVKAWIKYFQSVTQKGVKLRFIECSTAIVEQINLISNFTSGGEVESIYVPFTSEDDHSELVGLFKVSDLIKLNFEIPPLKNPKTGANAVFDDIPEEYFGFLMKK